MAPIVEEFQDWYAVLEVEASASPDDIKQSFKRLALLRHPDKNMANEMDSNAAMRLLNNAWDVLKDEDLRRSYDVKWRRHQKIQVPMYSKPKSEMAPSWGAQKGRIGVIRRVRNIISNTQLNFALRGFGKLDVQRGAGVSSTAIIHFSSPAVLQRACNSKPLTFELDDIKLVYRVVPFYIGSQAASQKISGITKQYPEIPEAYIYNIPNHIDTTTLRSVLETFGPIAKSHVSSQTATGSCFDFHILYSDKRSLEKASKACPLTVQNHFFMLQW